MYDQRRLDKAESFPHGTEGLRDSASVVSPIGFTTGTGSFRLGAPSGCLFGASAKSIARLAAVTASSRLTACPEFFPAVSNRTDHFQSPGLIPCRIRYSTPRCSMQPTPEDD